jgi:Leucine-rich repeat (LRR) protein
MELEMCDEHVPRDDALLLSEYLVGKANVISRLKDKGWDNLQDHPTAADRLDAVMRLLPDRLAHSLACDFAEQVLYVLPTGDFRPFDAIQAKRMWLEGTLTDDELAAATAAVSKLQDQIQIDYYNYDMEDDAEAAMRAASAVILATSRDIGETFAVARLASGAANLISLRGRGTNEWETRWQTIRLLKCLGVDDQTPVFTELPEEESELEAIDALRNNGASLELGEDGLVTSVRMAGYQVQGARHLARLTGLRHLAMGGSHMCDSYLDYVKDHASLEGLDLGEVSDAALVFLRRLVNLRSLRFWSARITDAGLVHIQELSSLANLDISSTKITGRGLAYLRRLDNLADLNVSDNTIEDDGLVYLCELTGLDQLDLSSTRITDRGLIHLRGLKSLTSLSLYDNALEDGCLEHVAKLSSLCYLDLHKTGVSDNGLRRLAGLTDLGYLNLTDSVVTGDGAESLSRSLPSCVIVASSGTWLGGEFSSGTEGLTGSARTASGNARAETGPEPLQVACGDCEAAAETTASYCGKCLRPLPRLREAHAFLVPGALIDVVRRPAQPLREPPSGASVPLPQPLVRDIEAIRRHGAPEREGGKFLCGTPSFRFTAAKRWAAAIPFIVVVMPVLAYALYLRYLGERSYGLVMLGGALVGLAVGFLGYVVAEALTQTIMASLVKRCQGDRLLGDRREFVYLCDEGFVWHDGRGLLYIPWDAMCGVKCNEDAEKMHTSFEFADLRTGHQHRIETFGFVGAYTRAQLRTMVAVAGQLAEPMPEKYATWMQSPPSRSGGQRTNEDATGTDARPVRKLVISECSNCGRRVVPKADGTCPSCQHRMP